MERKLIAAAVSSALALPLAAQAVEFSVSGHVNRAIISVDGTGADNDGDLQHVDANSSETRFRFTGSEELDSGMTAGIQLEIGRPSDWRTRHANAYLSSAAGRVTIGQASAASDGMAHADLGGPSWLGGATNWCSYASSGPACPSNDGGRMEVLRYDTPAIGPAAIAFSVGNDDYWDVKLSIAGSMGDAGYDLRIGHIGERDHMVPDPDMPAMDAVDAVPGTDDQMFNAAERIAGSDLLMVLQDENMPDPDPDNPGQFIANDFWDDQGERLDTATNDDTDVMAAVMAHVDGDDAVVAVDQLGADNTVNASTYLKTSTITIPGEEGTPAVAAVAQGMMEEKRGDITTASAAFAFGQGTSVALAWSQNNASDNEYQYVKLDHSYGDGSIGVYYKTGDTGDTGGSLVGVAVGHNMGGGATAYAGFRQMKEDNTDDVDLIVAGMRVTFN